MKTDDSLMFSRPRIKRIAAIVLGALLLDACAESASGANALAPAAEGPTNAEVLYGTTLWSARVPENWNGTLLLHSRGWAPMAGEPAAAPEQYVDALLAQGYALAASNYGAGGWALAEALPAQEQTIDAFAARYGQPARVIAYGYSMGGLVTTALVEKTTPKVDGGISFCSSMGGALGMMNMGLDGAFAFRTLVAPDSDIKVVGIEDDQRNGRLIRDVVEEAVSTPAGRARIALSAVYAGIPGWIRPDLPRPVPGDAEAEFEQIIDAFPSGVFLPRSEQERRTGGNFSWNAGIDYTQLLETSGRRGLIETLYEQAGISLETDLDTLAAAPRISAEASAAEYMRQNYTPRAEPGVPLLAVQTIGDGITSPSLQQVYAEYASAVMMDSQYVERAGHCTFDEAETLASLRHLETRLDTGEWPPRAPPFVAHEPAPMLRPCFDGKICR